jgi:hypothetical protein
MRVYQLVSWIIALSKQFTEEKLAQIAGAAMAVIKLAWHDADNAVGRRYERRSQGSISRGSAPAL